MQLNYGASNGRFSWILYKLENLRCAGKANGVIYPSEVYQNKIEEIEKDIEHNSIEISDLTERIDQTENDIEVRVSRPNFYFC